MKRLNKDDKAGLYITVIFHLTVIIILLASQLSLSIQKENSFVLDFTKQEQIERLQQELAFKEEVSRRLDELIATQGIDAASIRNVTVDRGSLRDDRNTDAEELYRDAERLRNELEGGRSLEDIEKDYVSVPDKNDDKKDDKKESYSGPSVVSYLLEGRKASRLPIPAYRCMGAGEVTVEIVVDNAGNVLIAKVNESVSSTDGCLRNFAIRAARSAKFSASPTAPARQQGNIVYAFIAQ